MADSDLNWDFKWQDIYRYVTPMMLPRETTLRMRFSYDNSAQNPRNPNKPPRRIVAGLRSVDEMAHLQLQVAPRSLLDAAVLRKRSTGTRSARIRMMRGGAQRARKRAAGSVKAG